MSPGLFILPLSDKALSHLKTSDTLGHFGTLARKLGPKPDLRKSVTFAKGAYSVVNEPKRRRMTSMDNYRLKLARSKQMPYRMV